MRFSLIMATYGKPGTLVVPFLESLAQQTYRDFELIVVDQNLDDSLKKISDHYLSYYPTKYFKTRQVGLSHARNLGLEHITGNIIAFPDDDCVYPPNLLEKVITYFQENKKVGFLSVSVRDKASGKRLSFTPIEKHTSIHGLNVFKAATSIGMFIQSPSPIPRFNEQLGLGTDLASCEEIDYVLGLINVGITGFYNPNLYVYHPDPLSSPRKYSLKNAANNARGYGGFFRKNLPTKQFLPLLPSFLYLMGIRPVGGILLGLATLKWEMVRRQWIILINRFWGFITYHPARS